jgi:DNA-binding NarL/FixJ family response regulator
MSQSAKKPEKKLSLFPVKTKTGNEKSLLDINLQVKEVRNKLQLIIQLEQTQLADFFTHILEKSLRDHFGFLSLRNDVSGDDLPCRTEERVSIYRIDRKAALSGREVEILKNLTKGNSNSKIADNFKIKTNTVRNHLQSIYLKLGVGDRFKAVIEYKRLFESINKNCPSPLNK